MPGYSQMPKQIKSYRMSSTRIRKEQGSGPNMQEQSGKEERKKYEKIKRHFTHSLQGNTEQHQFYAHQ